MFGSKILTIDDNIIFLDKICYIIPKDYRKNFIILFMFVDDSHLELTYSSKDDRDVVLKNIRQAMIKGD